jgi:hypothetical protein
MVIPGRVLNGVVVLQGGLSLSEGTVVTVLCPNPVNAQSSNGRKRVRLPLVPSAQPGSRQLTAERVAELLDKDDVSR